MREPAVVRVKGGMCCFGMYQEIGGSIVLVEKPTGFMTNPEDIARKLGLHCPGGHRRVHLLDGRAKRAEVYTDGLRLAILKGLVGQLQKDGRIDEHGLTTTAEDEARGNIVPKMVQPGMT